VFAAFQHGLQSGAQGKRGLAGARAAANGHDADGGVHQHVDGQPLLGGAAVEAEHVAVALDQAHVLVGANPAEGGAAVGQQDQPGVDGQFGGGRDIDGFVAVQGGDVLFIGFDFGNARPPGVLHQLVAVLVSGEAHGGGFDAHGQILGHDGDVASLIGQVLGDGEDAAVVVPAAEAQRRTSEEMWLSSTIKVPPSSPMGRGLFRPPCLTRRSSRSRRAVRAK
jgi:hypothetical protein